MLDSIVTSIVTVVQGLLEGLGTGLVGFFESAFVDATGGGLNSLGIFIMALLGITIALAAVRWVSSLVRRQN